MDPITDAELARIRHVFEATGGLGESDASDLLAEVARLRGVVEAEPVQWGVWCPPGNEFDYRLFESRNDALSEMDGYNADMEACGKSFRATIFPLYRGPDEAAEAAKET